MGLSKPVGASLGLGPLLALPPSGRIMPSWVKRWRSRARRSCGSAPARVHCRVVEDVAHSALSSCEAQVISSRIYGRRRWDPPSRSERPNSVVTFLAIVIASPVSN